MSIFALPKGAPRQPNTSSKVETEGATPFLLAADRADIPLMRLLLELGADPLLPNDNNTTPLLAAAGVGTGEPAEEAGEENEALEAVKMLLDLGADINGVNNDGETVMHGAAHGISPACHRAAGRAWSRSENLVQAQQIWPDATFHRRGLREPRRSPAS